MRLILLLLILVSSVCYPFVELQYRNTPAGNFELFGSTATMGRDAEDGSKKAPIIAFFGVNYRFQSIGYGFNLYPIELNNGDSLTWTSHNLYLQVFENFNLKYIKHSLQIGVTNVGLPKSSLKESNFNDYLQSYYITQRFQISGLSNVSFYVSSGPNGNNSEFFHRLAFDYTYKKNRAFLEFSPNENQIYVGGEVFVAKDFLFTIGSNLTTEDPDITGKFFPSTSLGIRLLNPFVKPKPKKKPVPPVDIDTKVFNTLEQGLIAYYESDYKKALQLYLNVIKKYPGFSLAHTRAGNAFFKLGQRQNAKKHWKKALTLDPKNKDLIQVLKQLENNDLLESSLLKD